MGAGEQNFCREQNSNIAKIKTNGKMGSTTQNVFIWLICDHISPWSHFVFFCFHFALLTSFCLLHFFYSSFFLCFHFAPCSVLVPLFRAPNLLFCYPFVSCSHSLVFFNFLFTRIFFFFFAAGISFVLLFPFFSFGINFNDLNLFC